jgi:hypothetical protein
MGFLHWTEIDAIIITLRRLARYFVSACGARKEESLDLRAKLQNKKTTMLIGFMGLHTEKGGIWAECDSKHSGQ